MCNDRKEERNIRETRSSVREDEFHQSALNLWVHLGCFDSTDKDSPGQVGLDDSEDLKFGVVLDLCSFEEFVDLGQ